MAPPTSFGPLRSAMEIVPALLQKVPDIVNVELPGAGWSKLDEMQSATPCEAVPRRSPRGATTSQPHEVKFLDY